FTAWNGAPNGGPEYNGSYGTNTVAITKVERHASDHRKVVVTLASNPATVYLRYMRPHEATSSSAYLQDVIRAADSGLRLPSFGPLRLPGACRAGRGQTPTARGARAARVGVRSQPSHA